MNGAGILFFFFFITLSQPLNADDVLDFSNLILENQIDKSEKKSNEFKVIQKSYHEFSLKKLYPKGKVFLNPLRDTKSSGQNFILFIFHEKFCKECLAQMQYFRENYPALKALNIKTFVITFLRNREEKRDLLRFYLKEKIPFTLLQDSFKLTKSRFLIPKLPSISIAHSEGRVLGGFNGFKKEKDQKLMNKLKAFIEEKPWLKKDLDF